MHEVSLQAGSADSVRDLDRHGTGTCRATATTDDQVDYRRCGHVGRPGRGRAVTYGDRYGGCCWAGTALIGGRSWRGRPGGPNLQKDNPKNPVRLPGGRTRLLPADWAPGGRQCPEELPWPSRASLERVSSCGPKAALTSPPRRRVAHTHRPLVRRPDPSALLAGTPTRISRSSRVGPSGRVQKLEAHQVAVKATFPLVRRVCPASGGSNYFDGIWGAEPSPWAKRARLPTGSVGTTTEGHGACVRGLLPGAPRQAAGRLRPQGAAQPAALAPAPGGRPGSAAP
jgi:hypothetical protein